MIWINIITHAVDSLIAEVFGQLWTHNNMLIDLLNIPKYNQVGPWQIDVKQRFTARIKVTLCRRVAAHSKRAKGLFALAIDEWTPNEENIINP